MYDDKNKLRIDPDAKIPVKLRKVFDSNEQPYYVGKLQFAGYLDFEKYGQSFMVFLSDDGAEELQIGPLDPNRTSKNQDTTAGMRRDGTIIVDLHPFFDKNDDVVYAGEAKCLGGIDVTEGLFFTVFVSKSGFEELQISRLNHSRRIAYERDKDYERRASNSGY
jgi:hypothetical protein